MKLEKESFPQVLLFPSRQDVLLSADQRRERHLHSAPNVPALPLRWNLPAGRAFRP
jgi:hypothetical protein